MFNRAEGGSVDPAAGLGSGETRAHGVLMVDDDINVLAAFRRQLLRRYAVQTASSGEEALRRLEGDPAVSVVVADMRMPGMDGLTLLKEIQRRTPGIVRVMLTGNADQATAINAVNEGQVFRFLTKPCSSALLCGTLDAAIHQYRLLEAERMMVTQAETVRRALDRERELNAMQRQFVSMISHELRTPMAVIGSAVELLDGPYPMTAEQTKRRFAQIKEAVRRMAELVDGTLSAVRLDEGHFEFHPELCDLNALVEVACKRQQEMAPNHVIALDRCDGPVALDADPRLLDHVLTNLLSNATKYSPTGHDIAVRVVREDGHAVTTVTDRGIGIPADEIPKLFQRFFRASTAIGVPGTGLGLHLVRHLVDLHGGSVDVDSAVGQGSTFTVRLPLPVVFK